MRYAARRVAQMPPTIFAEMTALAQRHQAINLGQGFPDFSAPDDIKQAAMRAIAADCNQYAPGAGVSALRQALAGYYRRHYRLDFDPESEILACVGATEAIFAAMLGLLDPGDEVILFDPAYDSYRPAIAFAGGIARSLVLRPPDWRLAPERLEALVTPRTRMLLLNSPHNPTGKVFSREELELLAAFCRRYDLLVVTDEVYEHLCYDGARHLPLASLPGMAERVLTVSSLGKSFSVTGWKVGWAVGPAPLVDAVHKAKQFATFCGATPLQTAAAEALAVEDDYYRQLAEDYRRRRDFLCQALAAAGLKPFVPAGTYFVMADISASGFIDDRDFCRALPEKAGVAAIPASPFYADPEAGRRLVRFTFCKSWPLLEEAATRLRRYFAA